MRPDLFVTGFAGKVNIAYGFPLCTPPDGHGVDPGRCKGAFRKGIFPPVRNQRLAGILGADAGPDLFDLRHYPIDIDMVGFTEELIATRRIF